MSASAIYAAGQFLWTREGAQLRQYRENATGELVPTTKLAVRVPEVALVVPTDSGRTLVVDDDVAVIDSSSGAWRVDLRLKLPTGIRVRAAFEDAGRIWVVSDADRP